METVIINCLKCGHKIEFHSETGQGKLALYDIHNVPDEVAVNVDGAIARCPGCGETVQINLQNKTITMTIS